MSRQSAVGVNESAVGSGQWAVRNTALLLSLLPTADCRLPTAHCPLPRNTTTPAHRCAGVVVVMLWELLVVARPAYLTMSFRLFKGRTLTTLRAGLALNICSCLVKGLIPLRALTAGF